MTYCFDIETGPRPDSGLFTRPFKPNAGWKDPEKIAAARIEFDKGMLEDAALDPITAQILMIVIGFESRAVRVLEHSPDEKAMLLEFWDIVLRVPLSTLVGFCSEDFDLPMLFARSWANGIKPPSYLRRGRYWSDYSMDLQKVWLCGRRPDKEGPRNDLGTVSRLLGCGEKNGNGAHFHMLYAQDPGAARDYALNDLALTMRVHEKLLGA